MSSYKFKNFVVDYHYPDWVGYINDYVAGGGTAEDLIEYGLGTSCRVFLIMCQLCSSGFVLFVCCSGLSTASILRSRATWSWQRRYVFMPQLASPLLWPTKA